MFFLFGLIFVLIGITFYVLSINDEKKEREKRDKRRERTFYVKEIKKKYPNAFEAYWGKADLANSVIKNYSTRRLSESSYDWSYEMWDILEKDIQQKRDEEQQKKLNDLFFELKRREELLRQTNPTAYEKYKTDITLEDINIENKLDSTFKNRHLPVNLP